PDELPQRLGLAARHRAGRGRAAAVRPRTRCRGVGVPAGRRAAGRDRGVRWPAAGAVLRVRARRVQPAGAVPDLLLTAGLGECRSAAAGARLPRARPGRTGAPARPRTADPTPVGPAEPGPAAAGYGGRAHLRAPGRGHG